MKKMTMVDFHYENKNHYLHISTNEKFQKNITASAHKFSKFTQMTFGFSINNKQKTTLHQSSRQEFYCARRTSGLLKTHQ